MNYYDIDPEDMTDDEKNALLRCLFFCLDHSGPGDLLWLGHKPSWRVLVEPRNRLAEILRRKEQRRQEIKDQIAALEVELAELEG